MDVSILSYKRIDRCISSQSYSKAKRHSVNHIYAATKFKLIRGLLIVSDIVSVFDNVDVDDVAKVALKWEQGVGLIRGGDIAARDKRWARGGSLTLESSKKVGDLANELCELARENSLDNTKDSPFAMLAKDNDIMWSGGKCSCVLPMFLSV